MKKPAESIIPPQQEGVEKNIVYTEDAVDTNDSRRMFLIARNRLVDVNHWHEFSSARFQLTDASGDDVFRTAEGGDYFRISINIPGPVKGDGYDWVFVEAVEDHSDPGGTEEYMAIRVRPASNPADRSTEDIAHFFSEGSTSSFVVSRSGNTVTAAVHGRNQKPNTSTTNVVDKVRNAVVALSAMAGLSDVQWKNLVRGFIPTA